METKLSQEDSREDTSGCAHYFLKETGHWTGWIQFWCWFKKTNMALENPPSSIVAAADYQALEADSPWYSLQQEELCS